jgi:hypothetical protein
MFICKINFKVRYNDTVKIFCIEFIQVYVMAIV